MAQTRYFQHLNENDPNFLQVTTLEFIDNSDGNLRYYFKDGSKCNKEFIAAINANTIQGFEFAEVSSPRNIWNLKVVIPTQEKPKAMKGDDGVIYEAPSWEDYTQYQGERKTRIDVIGMPMKIENFVVPDDNEYLIENVMNLSQLEPKKVNDSFNFNEPIVKNNKNTEISNVEFTNIDEEKHTKRQSDTYLISVKDLLNNYKKVVLEFPDGKIYEMKPDEFIENSITPMSEKEKIVEKEVIVKTSDTDIDLGIDTADKDLLDHMIDRSNKIECAIDMELSLKLPPTDIYKIIKSSYPEGMYKGFVNIIANRMQIKELKQSVAEGLMAFYEDECDNSENEQPVEKPNNSEPKKTSRKKADQK